MTNSVPTIAAKHPANVDLEAGEVILSGSLVPLEPVHQGDEMHLLMTGHGFDECSVSCQFI